MGPANLVLTGFMGTGKSTVARIVAERTGLTLVDTDQEIERAAGQPVPAIFAERGEAEFRRLEAEVVARVATGERQVIATGGGVVTQPENIAQLRRAGLVLSLTASTDLLWERVGAAGGRPLLAGDRPRERFEELYRSRAPLYAGADVTVDTTGLSAETVAGAVISHWRLAGAGQVRVDLGARSYPVYTGAGLLEAVGAAAAGSAGHGRRVALITEPRVEGLYAATVRRSLEECGFAVLPLRVPEGEAAKTLAVVEALYREAALAGLERDDLVLALGGGAVTDTAGFFAATFLRGLRLLNVPTTLLAQVDAAVGGKVGVNLDEGKNLVGAFHQPSGVVVDTGALASLPGREVRSGLAEVVKCGVIQDAALFSRLEAWDFPVSEVTAHQDELTAAVQAAIAVKAQVVGDDERESGRRVILNFGHTAAHAVEKAAGFGRVRHGEAVAYGMMVAARLAVRLGVAAPQVEQRLDQVLARLELPRRREELPASVAPADLLGLLGRDKKVRGGRVRWVLPRTIGEATVTSEVPESLVRECL
ncbi:MAG: 3-dehydroquinate synthase [Chitinophagales bacterium]